MISLTKKIKNPKQNLAKMKTHSIVISKSKIQKFGKETEHPSRNNIKYGHCFQLSVGK
jgi:hypothetical protein